MLEKLLPMVLPMVQKHLPKIEPAIIGYLADFPPMPGEKGVTAMLDVDGEKAYMSVVALDSHNSVCRIIRRERIGKFVENLLTSLK